MSGSRLRRRCAELLYCGLVGGARLIRLHLLAVEDDLRRGAEALVVGVLDDVANVHVFRHVAVTAGKVQNAFALGVDREPVVAVDLRPPGHEGRVQVFAALAGIVGNHAAVGHHDLQIGGVHPDAAQQVSMTLDDLLRAHVEDVAVDLVHLLPAHVLDVVLSDLRR